MNAALSVTIHRRPGLHLALVVLEPPWPVKSSLTFSFAKAPYGPFYPSTNEMTLARLNPSGVRSVFRRQAARWGRSSRWQGRPDDPIQKGTALGLTVEGTAERLGRICCQEGVSSSDTSRASARICKNRKQPTRDASTILVECTVQLRKCPAR